MRHSYTKGQWPNAITTGDICYDHVPDKCGMGEWFCLRDASHGIPVFGSVRASRGSEGGIQGQEVNVFNYPGQTEGIARELVNRWNAHRDLLEALKTLVEQRDAHFHTAQAWDAARAAIAKAEGAP